MTLRPLIGALAAMTLSAPAAFAQAPAAAPEAAPAAAAPAATGYRPVAPAGNILQTLRASGQFTTLLKVLDMGAISSLVGRPQPITLFAPTDAAFAAMPAGELNAMMQAGAVEQLRGRLVYLIFNGPLGFDQLQGKNGPVPGAGGQIYIDASGPQVKVNDANLLQPEVKVSNGSIYVIDRVIKPGYTPPPPPAEPAAAPAP